MSKGTRSERCLFFAITSRQQVQFEHTRPFVACVQVPSQQTRGTRARIRPAELDGRLVAEANKELTTTVFLRAGQRRRPEGPDGRQRNCSAAARESSKVIGGITETEQGVIENGGEAMEKGDRESLAVLVAGLQKELAKKNSFEGAVTSLTLMFRDLYKSAPEAEQRAMYAAACRAATLLHSRYTAPGFWTAGLKLFEQAEAVLHNPVEKRNMRGFTEKARAFLGEHSEREELPPQMRAGPSSGGFLFEGQLTMGPEPPRPPWLVHQTAIMNTLRENATRLFDTNDPNVEQEVTRRLQSIFNDARDGGGLQGQNPEFVGLEEAIAATLAEFGNMPRGPPPASKAEVAKLPVIEVTEEVLRRVGEGTECAVCREVLILGDKMQEMPCKHSFHPDCLKPWLEQHNSCPICRFEMPTDDREYELQKERDREYEEDRKARENSLPGGEFMYT